MANKYPHPVAPSPLLESHGAGRVTIITAATTDWNYGRKGRSADRNRKRRGKLPIRIVEFAVPR